MIKKILLGFLGLVVLLLLGLFIYVQSSWKKTYDWPGPKLQVSTDSAVIAKGRYLVNGPAHCMSCHVSGFDDMEAADNGQEISLKGGISFPMGPLGNMYPANLSPDPTTGIGRFTDEKIFRMMRHGIRPSGTATMTVLMPFYKMADDDLVAIVSYLRSQPPVENKVPDAEWTMMGKAVRTFSSIFQPIKDPQAPALAPPMAATVERGAYLANYVANCVGCHTQRDLMTYEATGPEFAGGMEFEPWVALNKHLKVDTSLWVRTPNITPDPGGAFARFKTPQQFIDRFRQGRVIAYSPMDWGPFSRMTDEDISALWMYFNSLKPVKKEIGEIVFKKIE